jgi:hypothetical protein
MSPPSSALAVIESGSSTPKPLRNASRYPDCDHGDDGDVLQEEVLADEPPDDLTERDVAVRVGRAGSRRHEAAWLERTVLEAGLPPWNRTAGGQETPVVITLDRRRPNPGVRLRHLPHESQDGVRIFGPYLRGLQVRRAVAGLHRIFPLAYAGTRLTGAERSMADEHGVSERDRNLLTAKLSAVLERDSDAVSAPLRHLTWPLPRRPGLSSLGEMPTSPQFLTDPAEADVGPARP